MRITAVLALAVLLVSCTGAPTPSGSPTAATSTTAAAPTTAGPSPAITSGPAGQRWARIADIPTPRSEVAATIFDGAIYVMGGFGGGRVVERFANGRWDRAPDLPISVDHPMAAAVSSGDRAGVYLIGGNVDGAPSARVFRLGKGAQRWEEVAKMPAPRAAGAAAGFEGWIWVVGGIARADTLHLSTYEYDTRTDKWSLRPDIPTPRDHLAAAVLQDKICAVGGRTLSMARNLPALECYDTEERTWSKLPSLPTARGGLGAAVVRDKLVVIGGEQPQGTFREVEIFDAQTNTWSRGPDLPTPRHGLGVVAIGNVVYVLAGGPTPGGSQTAICETLTLP